jgi:hypothetical protein
MHSNGKVWITWFFFGAAVAAALAMKTFFGFDETQMACETLGGIIFFMSIVAAILTRAGVGHEVHTAYRNGTIVRPFVIPPVRRPRIGGFSVGYSLATVILVVALYILR